MCVDKGVRRSIWVCSSEYLELKLKCSMLANAVSVSNKHIDFDLCR